MKNWRVTKIAVSVFRTYVDKRLPRSAAELAYYMVLALFPAIICVYDLLALIFSDPATVMSVVESLVLPLETSELISEFLQYVSGNTNDVMFVVALGVMVTSAATAYRAFAAIVGEIQGARRFHGVSNFLVSFAFSFAFLLAVFLCILLIMTGRHFLNLLDEVLPWVSIGGWWAWLRFVLLFFILLTMILGLYRLTVAPGCARRLLPGACFSAVGISAMSILFSWLIGRSAKYPLVYGSLASVVILLFWLNVFSLLLVLGSAFNHALEETEPPLPEIPEEKT